MVSITLKGNPISTNNLYFHIKTGIRIMSTKGKTLKEDYVWQVRQQYKDKPLSNLLEVFIKIYFSQKRKYDWDNFHKLSMDALTGIVWEDDSQVQKATVEKFYDKENPRIELTIKDYENN